MKLVPALLPQFVDDPFYGGLALVRVLDNNKHMKYEIMVLIVKQATGRAGEPESVGAGCFRLLGAGAGAA